MSEAVETGSQLIISGPTNSAVPNIILASSPASNFLDRPKSAILMEYDFFDFSKMFSGFKSRWTIHLLLILIRLFEFQSKLNITLTPKHSFLPTIQILNCKWQSNFPVKEKVAPKIETNPNLGLMFFSFIWKSLGHLWFKIPLPKTQNLSPECKEGSILIIQLLV